MNVFDEFFAEFEMRRSKCSFRERSLKELLFEREEE
jgi:hypothetical protein